MEKICDILDGFNIKYEVENDRILIGNYVIIFIEKEGYTDSTIINYYEKIDDYIDYLINNLKNIKKTEEVLNNLKGYVDKYMDYKTEVYSEKIENPVLKVITPDIEIDVLLTDRNTSTINDTIFLKLTQHTPSLIEGRWIADYATAYFELNKATKNFNSIKDNAPSETEIMVDVKISKLMPDEQ